MDIGSSMVAARIEQLEREKELDLARKRRERLLMKAQESPAQPIFSPVYSWRRRGFLPAIGQKG